VETCGSVSVKNAGPFGARICLDGYLNETQSAFCCSSLIFDVGVIAKIKVPCKAEKLKLIAEENNGVDEWELVGTHAFNNNTFDACYEIYDEYDLMQISKMIISAFSKSKYKIIQKCPRSKLLD